jgi:hypothetical protein
MKFIISFILFSLFPTISIPQVENVNADHPVYSFLKKMKVSGKLENYNDVILPLSKEAVINSLKKIDSNRDALNDTERDFLERMKMKFFTGTDNISSVDVLDGFPSKLPENLFNDNQKHLYHFIDSSITFYIDPIAEYKFIHSGLHKSNSSLLNYGGKLKGSYDNWLGFNVQGTIGLQFNSREAALLDKRVAQSFTFNDTKINYFDDTEGYIRLKKGIVSVQLGRERLLWGTGYVDKMILSDNPPDFDFIRFDISYKTLSYHFIHGWLIQPSFTVYEDSLIGKILNKESKYLAISRLNYEPYNKLRFGISQIVLYANRPFEAAYLNPFLFWESAQRSLNDLDNSYLVFDAGFIPVNGIEISSSIVLDDINLETWSKGEWTAYNNRLAWQAGAIITDPIIFDNISLKLEYLQIRPYTFSHFGINEALTYTNNGHFLGVDLQPNSTRFSAECRYIFSGKLFFSLTYKHTLHGANVYDDRGNLVKSVGGDILRPPFSTDNKFAPLLDGTREVTDMILFNINYELTNGIYFDFVYQYQNTSIKDFSRDTNNFWASLRLFFE